mgnify:CR=1 FL=1|jgi:ERCC4-type nuclease
MTSFNCKECGKEFGSEPSLHRHIKMHEMNLADYYTKHFPRKNLLTGEFLPFKNKADYFDKDFSTYSQLLKWCHASPPQDVKDYSLKKLKKRIRDKGLKFGPTHIELLLSEMPTVDIYKKFFTSYSHACSQAGVTPMLYRKLPENFFDVQNFDDLQIVIDTRENHPLPFKNTKKFALDFADYTASGNRYDYTFVERKSESDFKSTMSQNFSRFRREISRAKAMDSYVFIVIDSDIKKIKKQNHFSPHPANLKFIFHNMKALCHEFPETCQFIFSGNRTTSIDIIQRILYFGRKIWHCDLQYYIDARNYGLARRQSKTQTKQKSRHKQTAPRS